MKCEIFLTTPKSYNITEDTLVYIADLDLWKFCWVGDNDINIISIPRRLARWIKIRMGDCIPIIYHNLLKQAISIADNYKNEYTSIGIHIGTIYNDLLKTIKEV